MTGGGPDPGHLWTAAPCLPLTGAPERRWPCRPGIGDPFTTTRAECPDYDPFGETPLFQRQISSCERVRRFLPAIFGETASQNNEAYTAIATLGIGVPRTEAVLLSDSIVVMPGLVGLMPAVTIDFDLAVFGHAYREGRPLGSPSRSSS